MSKSEYERKRYRITDGQDIAEVVVGYFTGVKGLRVFIGPTDPISDMPVFVDAAHHHLHEGEMYQFTHGPVALGNGASLDFRVVVADVPATTRTPHVVAELDATGECWLELYESTTYSANGTAGTFQNRNRNVANSALTTIFTTPTVNALGTKISGWIVGSGEKAGGSGREAVEWPLKANTQYNYRITAKNAINICFRIMEYEDLGV